LEYSFILSTSIHAFVFVLQHYFISSSAIFFIGSNALQIARELRLRDIGGIIVVDFIDMTDEGEWESPSCCAFEVFSYSKKASL